MCAHLLVCTHFFTRKPSANEARCVNMGAQSQSAACIILYYAAGVTKDEENVTTPAK